MDKMFDLDLQVSSSQGDVTPNTIISGSCFGAQSCGVCVSINNCQSNVCTVGCVSAGCVSVGCASAQCSGDPCVMPNGGNI